jgi:Flp pilus assembly protein TadD
MAWRECRSLRRLLSYVEGAPRSSAETSDLPMQTIEQAKALHRMGRIAEAEAVYRSVLARNPREFDALHLLGLIRYQQGRPSEAHALLSQAIKLRPRSPQALSVFMASLRLAGSRRRWPPATG